LTVTVAVLLCGSVCNKLHSGLHCLSSLSIRKRYGWSIQYHR